MKSSGVTYSCNDCSIDFRRATSYYEHMVRLHGQNDSFVNSGDRKQRHAFPSGSSTAENEEQSVQSVEVKVECKTHDEGESEDEQIDVVTTKAEDMAVEQNEKND